MSADVAHQARELVVKILEEKKFGYHGFRFPPDPGAWHWTLAAWAVGALERDGWRLIPPAGVTK